MNFFMFIDAIIIVYALIKPFVLCYFATYASHSSLSIGEIVYNEIKWYQLPLSLRKRFCLIILRSQKPVHFTGFKIIRCTLETFSAVSEENLLFSCFPIFDFIFYLDSLSVRLRLTTSCSEG